VSLWYPLKSFMPTVMKQYKQFPTRVTRPCSSSGHNYIFIFKDFANPLLIMYSKLKSSGAFVSSGWLRTQLSNFHLPDKVTYVIVFAKHRFTFVVIFRNYDFYKMFQIRLFICTSISTLCCKTAFYQYSSKLHCKHLNNSNSWIYLKWTGTMYR